MGSSLISPDIASCSKDIVGFPNWIPFCCNWEKWLKALFEPLELLIEGDTWSSTYKPLVIPNIGCEPPPYWRIFEHWIFSTDWVIPWSKVLYFITIMGWVPWILPPKSYGIESCKNNPTTLWIFLNMASIWITSSNFCRICTIVRINQSNLK